MIVIVEPSPSWPREFESIRDVLAGALGPLAVRVDHIGSTSVPGMAAKDVIDVQVTVRALTEEIPARLVAAGFVHRGHITRDHVPAGEDPDPARWSKLLFVQRPGERRANIHVRAAGNPNQRYPLLFRDYLRAHPLAARSLERVKREIAKRHGDDILAYCEIKDPVCDLVMEAATAWARESGWSAPA